jgi:uncharacterized protein YjbI with pentapeptide repeats
MANLQHLAELRKGITKWNTWRTSNPEVIPDLTNADLGSKEDLRWTDLGGVDLSKADFTRVNLTGARLDGAHLSEANFTYANLNGADLAGADLRRADFTKADLTRANFSRADFSGANLSGATLAQTIFGSTNLKNVQGLESCNFLGPSIIDHLTLAQSWPLPLSFLRGCGLPDEFIEYLPALLNQAIQFYSCFISYSAQDQAFADRLYADLQNNNVRCWFAPHDIQAGKKIHEQIDEAIRVYDRLLLILSEASMNSEWVKTEIANARERELARGKRVLFPISLVPFETIRAWKHFDVDTGKDSAQDIREYYIPDFSNWKNQEAYTNAFRRLVLDLAASASEHREFVLGDR